MSLKYTGVKEGPIYQQRKETKKNSGVWELKGAFSEGQWTTKTTNLFTLAGLYTPATKTEKKKGVTNQGTHRSAAQWAGRCGGGELTIGNNGRWKTFEEMRRYTAQGAKRREEHERDAGKDPIFSAWVWKPVTVCSSSSRNEL